MTIMDASGITVHERSCPLTPHDCADYKGGRRIRFNTDDGGEFSIAQSVETRGRALFIDGSHFPWATSGDENRNIWVERTGNLVTLWVPIVVEGPVTITSAAHKDTDRARARRAEIADGVRAAGPDGRSEAIAKAMDLLGQDRPDVAEILRAAL